MKLIEPRPDPRPRCRCDRCGSDRWEAELHFGPRMLVGEPGAYSCASRRWYCARCTAVLWAQKLELEHRRAGFVDSEGEQLDLIGMAA